MAEQKITDNNVEQFGNVNISNDVVSIVASLAASSVKGVSGMVSSISGGIAELLGKKNMSKGVKVSVSDKEVTLDLAIIVEYGAKIPDVAWEIQEKVKSEVEAMTGLSVMAVNVSVEGVNVPRSDGDKIPPKNIGDVSDEAQEAEAAQEADTDAEPDNEGQSEPDNEQASGQDVNKETEPAAEDEPNAEADEGSIEL
ncbi:MAG TPA: Asp23/Gls24 family envelope stress response protein [Candidatus Monoglobus merdigallinarum]|uniref:Asp23/Gls24 family envelope stress response protein n=1 Tax=Candidatus Monoglobus merdigallinarum TaxID=2838698 RepID=A0A9D1TL73_9FIRM|nr:Asp23/Gls24 family envelope stress response protein [Candidatus Monoglobus merdigallinarum]